MLVATERSNAGLFQEMERMLTEKNRVNSGSRDLRAPMLIAAEGRGTGAVTVQRG